MNNKFISFQAASELSASSAVASVSAAHGAACSDNTVIFLFRKGRDDTVGIEVVVILAGHGKTVFVKIVGSVHTGLHIAHRSYKVVPYAAGAEQAGGEQEGDVLLGIGERPSSEQEQDAERDEEKADAEVFEIFKHGLAEWIWLRGLILSRAVFQFRCGFAFR